MEIERKYLISNVPENISQYPSRIIEQGYLSVNPVVRVRKDNDDYYLTYKGSGKLAREEYNLPLTRESYEHLIKKADGNVITKERFVIPDGTHTIELDFFHGVFEGRILAEVEFDSINDSNSYSPPVWFSKEVTEDAKYHNSNMSREIIN